MQLLQGALLEGSLSIEIQCGQFLSLTRSVLSRVITRHYCFLHHLTLCFIPFSFGPSHCSGGAMRMYLCLSKCPYV